MLRRRRHGGDSRFLRGLGRRFGARGRSDRFSRGRLLRLDGSGLFHRSAMAQQARAQNDGGEREKSDDAERGVIKLGQRRKQRWPLEVGLHEIVALARRSGADGDGLRGNIVLDGRRHRGAHHGFERFWSGHRSRRRLLRNE